MIFKKKEATLSSYNWLWVGYRKGLSIRILEILDEDPWKVQNITSAEREGSRLGIGRYRLSASYGRRMYLRNHINSVYSVQKLGSNRLMVIVRPLITNGSQIISAAILLLWSNAGTRPDDVCTVLVFVYILYLCIHCISSSRELILTWQLDYLICQPFTELAYWWPITFPYLRKDRYRYR